MKRQWQMQKSINRMIEFEDKYYQKNQRAS